jgi:adenosylcobinamide kinase/adenosylcobinamide-phosphate guanylyltransferase
LNGELILVIGGARSGKSAFAERLAASRASTVLYVATATASDAEMAARIAAHRARRPATWHTLEAPLAPARALRAQPTLPPVVLLDCLGLLVSNVLLAEGDAGDPAARLAALVDELLALVRERTLTLIVVTAEVGWSLVPTTALGRSFRDLLGDVNQRLAREASQVYLVVAGLALELRQLARPWDCSP